MANMNTTDNAGLIRNVMFNDVLGEKFTEENFMMTKFCEWMDDIEGAGTTVKIPGIGDTQLVDYVEGSEIQQFGLADTMFEFKPDTAKAGGVEITYEQLRDSYYMGQVLPFIPEDQANKSYTILEEYLFKLSQTLPVTVDGTKHRLVGSGTAGALSIADFSKAKAVIRKTAKLYSNYVAFITPEQASVIEQSIGITAQANQRFEAVAEQGLMDATGMSFLYNIYGVDVYVSAFIPVGLDYTGTSGIDETALDSVLVFSVTPRKLPFLAAWVDRPTFTFKDEPDFRKEKHMCYMSFGGKLRHPQNLVVIACTPAVL